MSEHSLLVKTNTHDEVTAVTLTDIKGDGLADRIRRQIEEIHDLEVEG